MSLPSLDSRLATLSESIKQTFLQIQQLSKPLHRPQSIGASMPSLVSEASDVSSLEAGRAELSADIQESLKQQEEELELLQQDMGDLIAPVSGDGRRQSAQAGQTMSEKEKGALRVNGGCVRLREDLKIARKRFRNAQLRAKNHDDAASQRERAAYLAGLQAAAAASSSNSDNEKGNDTTEPSRDVLFAGRRGPRRDPNATQDDMMLSASSDVTSSLRRTHALLTSELSRSQFAHDTLESSNRALKELNERYTSLDDMLAKSRGLLKTLLKSKKTNEWYLATTKWILVGTIAWIFFRKIVYGPSWWFLYLPLKLLYKFVFWILGMLFGLSNRPTSVSVAEELKSIKLMTREPETSLTMADTISLQTASAHPDPMLSGARSQPGTLSEEIGEVVETIMSSTGAPQAGATEGADQAQQQEQGSHQQEQAGQQQAGDQAQQQRQRGDGQQLPERDHERNPPNPKKRMMEEQPPPAPQQQQKRDEL